MADRIQLNPKSNAKLSRRGLIIGGLQTAFIAGLAIRMRKLQVEDAGETQCERAGAAPRVGGRAVVAVVCRRCVIVHSQSNRAVDTTTRAR